MMGMFLVAEFKIILLFLVGIKSTMIAALMKEMTFSNTVYSNDCISKSLKISENVNLFYDKARLVQAVILCDSPNTTLYL